MKHIKLSITLETIITRLFTAWIIISLFNSLYSADFLSLAFVERETLAFFLLKVFCLFIVLTLISGVQRSTLDVALLFLSTLLYSTRVVSGSDNVYLLAGVCLFNVFVLAYYYPVLKEILSRLPMPKNIVWIGIILLGIALTLFIFFTTLCRHQLGRTSTFDMGIFIQMFHNMREHGIMITTCERNELLSHLNVHTSLFYYILLPFYAIFPSASILLFLQAAAILIGFFPLLLLCRQFGFSKKSMLLVACIYGLAPAVSGGCFYDFHENVFLIPLLLSLFYSLERRYFIRTLLFALLVCSVKEDACLFVIILGVFSLFSKQYYKEGGCLLGIGGGAMAISFSYLSSHGEGLMTNHYSNLVSESEEGLLAILHTLVSNPGYLFTQMFQEEKIPFLIIVLLPLLTLIICTKKYSRFLLLIPFLFINVLPSYSYQHSVFYQYVFGPCMFLLYLCMLNAADLKNTEQNRRMLYCAVFACYAFVSQIIPKSYYLKDYKEYPKQVAAIKELSNILPKEASISANTFLVPQLAKRDTIYMIDGTIVERDTIYDTDYAVFDARSGYQDDNMEDEIKRYEQEGYTTYLEKPRVYIILQASNSATP